MPFNRNKSPIAQEREAQDLILYAKNNGTRVRQGLRGRLGSLVWAGPRWFRPAENIFP